MIQDAINNRDYTYLETYLSEIIDEFVNNDYLVNAEVGMWFLNKDEFFDNIQNKIMSQQTRILVMLMNNFNNIDDFTNAIMKINEHKSSKRGFTSIVISIYRIIMSDVMYESMVLMDKHLNYNFLQFSIAPNNIVEKLGQETLEYIKNNVEILNIQDLSIIERNFLDTYLGLNNYHDLIGTEKLIQLLSTQKDQLSSIFGHTLKLSNITNMSLKDVLKIIRNMLKWSPAPTSIDVLRVFNIINHIDDFTKEEIQDILNVYKELSNAQITNISFPKNVYQQLTVEQFKSLNLKYDTSKFMLAKDATLEEYYNTYGRGTSNIPLAYYMPTNEDIQQYPQSITINILKSGRLYITRETMKVFNKHYNSRYRYNKDWSDFKSIVEKNNTSAELTKKYYLYLLHELTPSNKEIISALNTKIIKLFGEELKAIRILHRNTI